MAAMTQNTIVAQTGVWCVAGGFIRTLTRNVARGSCSTVVSSRACSFVLEARWRHMLGVLPSPLWGGVGGGGRAILRSWRHRHLAAPPPPHPSPSRLRACPLPANFSVTKPRQAGVWLGEGADRVCCA